MKNYFSVFFTSFLIFSCNQGIDYKSIIQEYESEELLCVSLLEIEGKSMLFGSNFTGTCLSYNNELTKKEMLLSYKDGVQEGLVIGYYPDGKPEYVGYRNNGEINGNFIKLHNNGEVEIKGQFKNGIYIGVFKYYDERGKKIEQRRYNNFGILMRTKKY
jgi:antitoxin component YwqK of YwqJK toxin-antitoxin module